MSILGGSPLGIIGAGSSSVGGNSGFNGGKSRNVNVFKYNSGAKDANTLKGNSLFTGTRIVRAFPETINNIGGGEPFKQRKDLHDNSIYDTSILNIIGKLAGTKASLQPADFIYLKNVGVNPNNRLMIARRFASAIGDNLMSKREANQVGSIATLISWMPQGDEFLSITFGEKWEDSAADFKELLNSLGKDIMGKAGNALGAISGGLGNVVPIPGFTEIFQREILRNMGIFNEGATDEQLSGNQIPSGNPNLIKESKRRQLIGYGSAGSGLMCTVSIVMKCEWELKFIAGIDPTIVWMDILSMITRFGTSESETYDLSTNLVKKAKLWMDNPRKLVEEVAGALSKGMQKIKEQLTTKIAEIKAKLDEKAAVTGKTEEDIKADKASDQAEQQSKIIDSIAQIGIKALTGIIQKYKVEIMGILNSLSGLPSTPWHITIGNPMRPIFTSGDMLTQQVTIKLGPVLAFNDLPSSIQAEFTLVNARNWGMQEIMAKFNSGYLRTIDAQKSYFETKGSQLSGQISTDVTVVKESVGNTASTASTSGSTGETKKEKDNPTKEEGGKKPSN